MLLLKSCSVNEKNGMTEWIQRNENHLTDTSFFDDLKSRKWKKKKNVKIKKKKKNPGKTDKAAPTPCRQTCRHLK